WSTAASGCRGPGHTGHARPHTWETTLMTSSRLSRFGDVLQIVVCLIVLAIALSTYVNRTAGSSAVGSRAALESGIPMDQLPGVSFAARPLTLILFERSDCTFCTQSMPFYRELSTFIDKARVQFVVASWERSEERRVGKGCGYGV